MECGYHLHKYTGIQRKNIVEGHRLFRANQFVSKQQVLQYKSWKYGKAYRIQEGMNIQDENVDSRYIQHMILHL